MTQVIALTFTDTATGRIDASRFTKLNERLLILFIEGGANRKFLHRVECVWARQTQKSKCVSQLIPPLYIYISLNIQCFKPGSVFKLSRWKETEFPILWYVREQGKICIIRWVATLYRESSQFGVITLVRGCDAAC